MNLAVSRGKHVSMHKTQVNHRRGKAAVESYVSYFQSSVEGNRGAEDGWGQGILFFYRCIIFTFFRNHNILFLGLSLFRFSSSFDKKQNIKQNSIKQFFYIFFTGCFLFSPPPRLRCFPPLPPSLPPSLLFILLLQFPSLFCFFLLELPSSYSHSYRKKRWRRRRRRKRKRKRKRKRRRERRRRRRRRRRRSCTFLILAPCRASQLKPSRSLNVLG